MNGVILSKDEALKALGISGGQVLSKDQALRSINNVNWTAAEQKTAANLQSVANIRKQATISPITSTESAASGQKSPSLGVITDANTYDAVGDRVRAERYAIMQQRQGKTVPAALDTIKGTGIASQVQRIADKGDSVTNADIDMLRDLRAGLVSSLPDNSMTQAEFLQMQRDGTLAAYQTPQSEKDTNAQIDALDDLIKAAKQRAEMSGERPTTTQRIGAGVQAIGSSTAAALPMLGAAAVQAGKDTIQNLSNPEYRAALWERIKKGMDTDAMQRLDQATVSNSVSLDSAGVQKMRESNQSRERMLEGLTPAQRFIGEGLYSVADNATTLPLAAINPSLPLYAMGTKAAAGRTYELTEQGKSAGEALTRGIVSGVIEGVTEKIPLDSVLDIIKTGGKGYAANMLKQTVIEAGEEGLSYLLNYTADKLAKDPNAQFTVQELMHQMALGGFSGLIMAGGGTVANRVANVDMLAGLGKGTTEQAAPPVASGTQQTAPDYKLGDLQPQEQPQNRQMLSAVDALFEEQAAQKAQVGESMAADLDMYPKSEIQRSETQQDTRHILAKLKENIPSMQGVEAVTVLSGSEFSKSNKKLTETVGDFFRSLGNKVFRNGVGDVILDENGIKSDIAHGIGRAKAVTFAAVPDVIAKGQQIDYQQNWKDRGYDTLVFAAPVKIGNQISYVATVVRKAKNSNRFYLHEVLDENGNIIYTKKEPNSFKTGPGAETSATGELDSSHNTNIAQVANGVNNIISDSNAKNAESKSDMLAMFSGDERLKLHAISPDMLSLLNNKTNIQDYFTPHEGLEGNREHLNTPSLTERIGEGERAFDGVKALLEAAKQDKEIRGNEAIKQNTAEVLTERPGKSARENITDGAEWTYRKFFDNGYTIGKVARAVGDEVLYPLFNNAKASHVAAQYMIGSAQTDINGREVGRGLMDIFAPAKTKGNDYFRQFQEYLYHMHNIDRMSLETAGRSVYSEMINEIAEKYPSITEADQWRKLAAEGNADASQWLKLNANMERLKNKPVFGPKMGARESFDYASGLLAAHPEFEEMAGEVYNYNRNLMKMRIDAGLLSQAQADLFERLYPHYVPAYRESESPALHEENFRRAKVNTTVKQAMGGSADLLPIDDSMARQTLQVVANANRNLFGIRLLENALKSRDKVGREVQNFEDLDLGAQEMEDPANLQNVFMVYVAGKPVKMVVSNGMMEGVRAIMPKQSDMSGLLKAHLNAFNTFKASVTGWNPAFLVKNGIRDIQDAGIYSRDYAAMLKNYPRAWQEMRSNGELWRLYLSKGGTGSSVFDYDTGFKDVYGHRNALETTLDKVEQANLMVEQAPRFAEFLGVIDEGGTGYENVQKALLAAADATVNFGRSGSWGKILNRGIVPFFNPAMQGIDKTARTFINAYRNKDMVRLIGRAALVGVLPQVLNALIFRDDDEYDMISDRDKDNYYLIKVKEGLWVKLPKGRVLSVFGNPAQRAMRQLGGEDAGDAWAGVVGTTLENNLPENPLRRNFLTPLLEADLLDSDSPGKTWYKSDIEPQRLRKFAPGERYDETTDAISKAVGGALNVSPKKINYVMDSYTGVVGDMLLPLMTPKAEKSVFERSFLIDPVLNNKLSEKFYDTYNNAQYAYNSKAVTPGDTAVYKALGSVSSALSDMYSEIRDIENSDMPNKEKQSEVRALREQINSLLADAIDSVDEIRSTADNDFAGIPQEVYYNAMVAVKDVKSDKGKDGNTVSLSASKNKKAAIDQVAQGLTIEQKRKLYKAFNVSEKVW